MRRRSRARGRRRLSRSPSGGAERKIPPQKKREESRYRKHIASLLGAVLELRVARMQYYSASSGRTKEYLVAPYRLAYAQGGMYLLAQVLQYRQLRTFAIERIKTLSVTSQIFAAPEAAQAEPFSNSLGVNTGEPQRVEIEFAAEPAMHIRERSWHSSQQIRERTNGSVRLTLNVCNDWALRSWIFSGGPLARVVSPSSLAESILEQLEEARNGYARQLDLEIAGSAFGPADHPRLPFRNQ